MKLYPGIFISLLSLVLLSCGDTDGGGDQRNAEGSGADGEATSTIGPGGITLLEGYEHVRLEGADGETGRLTKAAGPTILYRIGWVAGNYTASLAEERGLSLETEEVGDRTFQMLQDGALTFMTMTKEGGDSALWPANFQAPITDPESVEEMREMVRSYDPE